MANSIRVNAQLTIHEGKHEEFRKAVSHVVGLVRSNEPDTLDYELYVDGDTCHVVETYKDSDALMAHGGNVGEALGQLMGISTLDAVYVYGDVSPQVLEAFAAFSPKQMDYLDGVSR